MFCAASPAWAAKASGRGSLKVTITGLPKGQKPNAVIVGKSKKVKLKKQTQTIKGLKSGSYKLKLKKLTITKAQKAVRKGALASPDKKTVTITVTKGKNSVTGNYGNIVNRNVKALTSTPTVSKGSASAPKELSFGKGTKLPPAGGFITSGPTAALPEGLVARVDKIVSKGNNKTVAITNVPIGEAIPSFNLESAVRATEIQSASARSSIAEPRAAKKGGLSCSTTPAIPKTQSDLLKQLFEVKFEEEPNVRDLNWQWNTGRFNMELAMRLRETMGPRETYPALKLECAAGIRDFHFEKAGVHGYIDFGVNLGGALHGEFGPFTINHAHTVVMKISAGLSGSNVSIWQEGQNTWAEGNAKLASVEFNSDLSAGISLGTDKLSADMNLVIGSNHIEWTPKGCTVSYEVGKFSGNLKIWKWNIGLPTKTAMRDSVSSPMPGCPGATSTPSPPPSGGTGGSGTPGGSTTTAPPTTPPTPPTAPTTAVGIAAGGAHTCAILTGGKVQCWGLGNQGQLGDGTNTSLSTTPVTAIQSGATDIGAGRYHTCAILTGGKAKCWGWNDSGRLGDGTTTNRTTPVTAIQSGATDIDAGSAHTCAILTGGKVQCWGNNDSLQLRVGTNTSSSTTPVTAIQSGATAVTAAGGDTCMIETGGKVQCWGYHGGSPAVIGATHITTSSAHTCAILTGGKVQCWGQGYEGQLGDGTNTNRVVPTNVKFSP